MMEITLDRECFVRDEGTVLVLQGWNPRGREVTFAVDRRVGYDLVNATLHGEIIEVGIEPWQVLGVLRSA